MDHSLDSFPKFHTVIAIRSWPDRCSEIKLFRGSGNSILPAKNKKNERKRG